MAKNSNKINNDDNMIPSGEDQYLLGYNDAERLEQTKPGLAKVFMETEFFETYSHPEYVKGYSDYTTKNIPVVEVKLGGDVSDEEANAAFVNWLTEVLKPLSDAQNKKGSKTS